MELSIEVHDRKTTTKLLDKREEFPSYINHMPYLDIYILHKYFVLRSVHKRKRKKTDMIIMVARAKLLLIKMKKLSSECVRII